MLKQRIKAQQLPQLRRDDSERGTESSHIASKQPPLTTWRQLEMKQGEEIRCKLTTLFFFEKSKSVLF